MKLWNCLKTEMLEKPYQKICENDIDMTFEETVVFAESFAKQLSTEKCCAIICKSEMMTAISLLSCYAAGVTAVPLSLRYGELHCNKILDTISPTAVITDLNKELKVTHLTKSKYCEPDIHPAIIMCTSGTTGKPKGVMLTEDNILTNVYDICDYFKLNSEDSILIARPLYHCAVLVGEFLTSLFKGTNIRFYSESFNPKILLEIIIKHNITVFCGTPTLLSMLARFKGKKTDCNLKKICVSGECMSKETGKQIAQAFNNLEIYHVYGLTEACPRVSFLPPPLFREYGDCVGIPLRSVSLKIISSKGKKANINEIGTLWIKGDNVMSGYYNDPDKTGEVLKEGWLCTGDLALINEKGLLKIKGRSDDLIIKAGMNIYPQEIESALKMDSRVRDVLAYKTENSKLGVQIGLKISGDFTNTNEVKALCNDLLPSFQIPTVIELLDELPKNGSGKIVRR